MGGHIHYQFEVLNLEGGCSMCGLPYPVEKNWGKQRGTGVWSMGGSKASKDSLLKVNRCPETCCICSQQ